MPFKGRELKLETLVLNGPAGPPAVSGSSSLLNFK